MNLERIKNYLILLMLIIMVIMANYKPKDKLSEMAKYSYMTGCYQEALIICPDFKSPQKEVECIDSALKNCPIKALDFKKWIESGKK